ERVADQRFSHVLCHIIVDQPGQLPGFVRLTNIAVPFRESGTVGPDWATGLETALAWVVGNPARWGNRKGNCNTKCIRRWNESSPTFGGGCSAAVARADIETASGVGVTPRRADRR